MSAATEQDQRSDADKQAEREASRDPRVRAAREIAGGDKNMEMVAHAAQGAQLDDGEERAALDYLLGARSPSRYEVEVDYFTADGPAKMWFVVRSTDTRKIDAAEDRNVDQNTGRIDRLTADCEIVALACEAIRDQSGRVVKLRDQEFLTISQRNTETGELESMPVASPAIALDARFRDQLGLIAGVSLEIKRVAGFSPDRVSRAKRMQVAAALG